MNKLDFVKKKIIEIAGASATMHLEEHIRSASYSSAIIKHGGFNKETLQEAQESLVKELEWIKGYLLGLYHAKAISYTAMEIAERDVRKIIENIKGTWEEIREYEG